MDRRTCKVVMDRWQEMLVENKMGSLGFGGHFAGCGHEGPQPRQIEAKGRPAEKLPASGRPPASRNNSTAPVRGPQSARERPHGSFTLLQALDAPHGAQSASWMSSSGCRGHPHKRLSPFSANTRFAPGARLKPNRTFTQPIPPGPPLTTHSGDRPLRERSANKNYTGVGRQRCDPRSRRLCIFCMP